MFEMLRPFIDPADNWLTVGDGIGTDANWLFEQGVKVVASDLSIDILKKVLTGNLLPSTNRKMRKIFHLRMVRFRMFYVKKLFIISRARIWLFMKWCESQKKQ